MEKEKSELVLSAHVASPDPVYPWLPTEWQRLPGKNGSFPQVVEEAGGAGLPGRAAEPRLVEKNSRWIKC